jgi:hypothetical protein
MFGFQSTGSPLDPIAHIIQIALTPVFLLSGIATLLSVFSARLARVADQVDSTAAALEGADPGEAAHLARRLQHLHRRSVALDVAVVLGAIGGASTCAAVLVLFLGALGEAAVATALFMLFGMAVVCALGAIAGFTAEMLMAGVGIRAEVAKGRRSAAEDESPETPEGPDVTAAPPSAA